MIRALALTLVLLTSSAAAAQSADPADLNRRATEAYEAGRFEESASLLEQLYALHSDPTILYNIARARESSGDLAAARDAYTRFLAAAPESAPQRSRVRVRLEVIEGELARRDAALAAGEASTTMPTAPPQAPDDDAGAEAITNSRPPPDRALDPVPFVIAGVGLLGLVGAIVPSVLAADRASSAEHAPDHRTGVALAGEANDFALIANVMYAVAGVVTLVGGIWTIVELGSDHRGSSASLRLGPSSVTLEGRF